MKGTGDYLKKLVLVFQKHKNAVQAAGAKAYMKNKFEFVGLSSPVRRELMKEFFKENHLPPAGQTEKLIRECWDRNEREYQYFGMELLEKQMKKDFRPSVKLLEFMITTKSWWDTVDFIAAKLVGKFVQGDPDYLTKLSERWINSGNLWLMRSAILSQLKYKRKTDKELLFKLILKAKGEKDFFIRKAIGWALREYSKTNPVAVRNFVNKTELSNLSRKEALRLMEPANSSSR